jgi:chitodextrinase
VTVESPALSASVQVGAYSIDVGSGSGSFVQYQPNGGRENADVLEAALQDDQEERDDRPTPVAAIEEFQETADEVTGKIERADKLLQSAASGQLLDLSNVSGEIDSLLGLLGRLDRAGRFEEELRLMRSLNGLLALSLRWLDLIRSLRSLLRSAEAAHHAAGQAFAHHELGSLYLCAGRPERAIDHLERATRLQKQIRIPSAGRCATRHNLDSAHRDLAVQAAEGFQPPRRLQRLVLLAGAIAVAAASGAGIALAVHGKHRPQATVPPPTSPQPPHTKTHKVVVQLAGTGTGFVRGGGLSCPNTCSVSIKNGRTITLTATHANGSTFTRWSRAGCGTSATCKLTVTRALAVTATFSPAGHVPVSQRPGAPTGLRAAVVSANEIDLSWVKPAGSAVVVGYVVYRDQQELATLAGTTTVYQDDAVQPATGYAYTVEALGARGSTSPQSATARATTPALEDRQPPSAPTDLSAKALSTSEVDLSWTASTDDVGVSGYVIYRDGKPVTTVPGTFTSYADTGLAYGSFYTYTVQAVDAAGNSSPQSSPARATTAPG